MKVRIKLASSDLSKLQFICSQILDIAKKAGIDVRGPIPLPTKRLKVSVRKSPCGGGRETYEVWEKRIYKRVIEVGAHERLLRAIMRLPITKDVSIEVKVLGKA